MSDPISNYFSWKARMIATISGSVSMMSSALAITIILRCNQRLSSPYHRIMFFMCFWDVLSSAATAFTIIPMPSNIQETYPFPGSAYGNATTCTMQAFLIVTGNGWALCANAVLNVFYVCKIRYGISEMTLNRRMLPIALGFACLLVLPATLTPLFLGLLNPTSRDPYCLIGAYPENCNRVDDIECIRGDVAPETEDLIMYAYTSILGGLFLLVVVSLFLVFVSVFKTERTTWRLRKEEQEEKKKHRSSTLFTLQQNEDDEDRLQLQRDDDDDAAADEPSPHFFRSKELRETRIVGRVALMYIAAFFFTWIWTVISSLPIDEFKNFTQETWDFIGDMRLLFTPLQGFFNSFIFIYNKVDNFRNNLSSEDDDVAFFEAFKRVIISPQIIPLEMAISSLDAVENNIAFHRNKHSEKKSEASSFEMKYRNANCTKK